MGNFFCFKSKSKVSWAILMSDSRNKTDCFIKYFSDALHMGFVQLICVSGAFMLPFFWLKPSHMLKTLRLYRPKFS